MPSIILGATASTFISKNISYSYQINNTAFNADVCVQYDTSAIVTDTCVFSILNPLLQITTLLKKAVLEQEQCFRWCLAIARYVHSLI
ncbi:DUF3172 domain-containing protein [Nostoc sp. KVJ3]|uniref:DUF3172 domain-containing protein n=1 Tax=Nostoc sp. KVJ3 TaxID=457945 RepID=UPI002238D88C|nr:DUF3172 domain-containing protein [Nostoc sp. KVJ3]MCW5313883.1 DUF3172 domain-containing protein [Nostoc sp. KVJ3]